MTFAGSGASLPIEIERLAVELDVENVVVVRVGFVGIAVHILVYMKRYSNRK